jgi:hypothetical protein
MIGTQLVAALHAHLLVLAESSGKLVQQSLADEIDRGIFTSVADLKPKILRPIRLR